MTDGAPTRGRLLIADDDGTIRTGLTALLRRHGYECDSAANAAEALASLRAAPFDALISDIHMPGNTGLELVESAAQIAAGMPILLLTGRPSVESAARSVRLAVTAYLTKPPNLTEMMAILDPAIADYRALRAMEAGRSRLHAWEREIERIEAQLRATPGARAGGSMGSYLRLTLRQVLLTLSDLEQAAAALERPGAASLTTVDHEAALRHAVDVLERTRQNFKSKDLAELRKQLEQLLARSSPGNGESSPGL
jgi:CheY-like chemotaxis protein